VIRPPAMERETETGSGLEPTGLVDPRAVHPAPAEVQPGPGPVATPGPEEGDGLGEAPAPESSVPGAGSPGMEDPRASLPGPDLRP